MSVQIDEKCHTVLTISAFFGTEVDQFGPLILKQDDHVSSFGNDGSTLSFARQSSFHVLGFPWWKAYQTNESRFNWNKFIRNNFHEIMLK